MHQCREIWVHFFLIFLQKSCIYQKDFIILSYQNKQILFNNKNTTTMNYNRRYFEKDGKKYIEVKDLYNTRVFEVVEEFPQGYVLWKVPENYPDVGYIALAKPSNIPYYIIQKDLKCMFVGEEMWEKLHNYCNKDNWINATNFKSVFNSLKLDL